VSTEGIQGIMIETKSWKESKAFWTALGYQLEFETGHGSGQLRHPSGGPYVFVVERAEGSHLEVQPVLGVADSTTFEPPANGTVAIPFTARHWGVHEMLVRDPDGRRFSFQAPLPEGVEAPSGDS
jgi:catechol 2,3-dioxygenase-like lactoylglutathione lyase family enzyme